MVEQAYAGDVTPEQAWECLRDDPSAVLVDVRTDAEWRLVGLPDLTELGKRTICVGWQLYPDMRLNPGFVAALEDLGLRRDQTFLFLCRSGVRSRHAAVAMTTAGFGACYNVAHGFEGPHDAEGHRGRQAGWKASGLPWTQE